MQPEPTVYIGADHAGWAMKEELEVFLKQNGYEVEDMGNEQLVETDDYPDFGHAVAKRVVTDDNAVGVLLCGSAQGICIVANKVKGVRAVTGFDEEEAVATRTDDDSNVLCLPARFLTVEKAKTILGAWLEAPFSGAERHQRRLEKLKRIEDEEFNT